MSKGDRIDNSVLLNAGLELMQQNSKPPYQNAQHGAFYAFQTTGWHHRTYQNLQ